jgi:hypothetical protein
MKRNRNLLILCLGLFLAGGLSCSGDVPFATEVGGDAPAGDAPASPGDNPDVPPADSGGVPPVDSTSGPIQADLLICQQQEYAINTAVIGPGGGEITVGDHTLKISAGALLQDVTITAEQVEGTVTSVRFSPEGLIFALPAELRLSYKNCDDVQRSKRIVYTDELLNVLEPTLSEDYSGGRYVEGLILHFSRYAVAY